VSEPLSVVDTPTNVVFVLLDSLNRHMLGAYGSDEFETPNIDRLAACSLRFTSHYAGSLPCIPARHDILCGALDFLWRPWGSVELWEVTLPYALRRAGVVTQLISDHPHLFETGGENYHTDFFAWDYLRGHESDPWKTLTDLSWVGVPTRQHPAAEYPYDRSKTWFRTESDFPGPKTMQAAADWLDANAGRHERFFLFVDEFDPHEPFDTPGPWATRYDASWEGPRLIWPPYTRNGVTSGVLTEREGAQLRANYGAKLSMIDCWLGRVLDALDRNNLWHSTALVVCSDHGHYLGEQDTWGKPPSPIFEPMGHIPLLIRWPGTGARDIDALTTSVDLFATMLSIFDASVDHRTQGRELVPLINGETSEVRDHILSGIWGREVHVITPELKYACAPLGHNAPLSMWSNRWSTMPYPEFPELRLPPPDSRAFLDRMPGSQVPVIRQPFVPGDMLPYWVEGDFSGNHLYAIRDDPLEEENRAGSGGEDEARALLRHALEEVHAPQDQFERLGLA
jgi:arylsulfatase A-like enzyme